ncbi:MAG TPA: hypothetical protein VFZ61_30260 [Polyangiales bacterium]
MVTRPEPCLVRRTGALLGVALTLAGCVDPAARFDEFVAREEAAKMPPGGGGEPVPDAGFVLPTPEQSAGNFLLAVSTGLGRTKPVVSLLEVEADDQDGQLELRLRYRPLAASDRKTPVGEFNAWQSVLVNADGTYTAPSIRVAVPGAANPIDGSNIEADLTLQGRPTAKVEPGKTVDFLCGDVSGTLFAYGLPLPLAGSTFTATRIVDPDAYPDVTIDCQMNPAAPLP